MRKMSWTVGAVAVVMLVAVVTATAGGSHGKHIIMGEDGEKIDLSELYDGEVRTFGEGEHQITATRTGDVIAITLGDTERVKTIDCIANEDQCFVLLPEDGDGARILITSDDGGQMTKEVMVMAFDDEHDNVFFGGHGEGHGNTQVFVTANGDDFEWVSEDGHDVQVIAGGHGEAGAGLLRLHRDGTVLRCPEGDTTMRLKKGEENEGPFLCPRHNLELEKVEHTRLLREFQLRAHDDEDDD